MDENEYEKNRYSQLPWTEKYRPKTIDNLVLPNELKTKLNNFIDDKNIPNLIFTGPSGIGKTSTVRCIARQFYGKYYNKSVLELNASDDRGIKSIQSDITSFCKIRLPFNKEDVDKYPKFKLIILDEADNMVDRSQPQINTIMEQYKNTIKFAFTCNSSSNIIEAIQSRCVILTYMRLDLNLVMSKLSEIADNENIKYDKKSLVKIYELSSGDMRQSINILQILYNKNGSIKESDVEELYDLPQHVIIRKLFDHAIKKDLKNALVITLELKNNGYSGSDIMLGMLATLKSEICDDIPEKLKITIYNCVCMTAYRISKGVDSTLQLASCVVDIVKCM